MADIGSDSDQQPSIGESLASFLEYMDDTISLLDLTKAGAHSLLGVRKLNERVKEAFEEADRPFRDDQQERLRMATDTANLAQKEIDRASHCSIITR